MTKQDGTQAIRRAAAILQQIAHVSDGQPPTLRSLSQAVDLPRSTTHRILKCLTEEGLVAYDEASRRYEIGMLSYELGLAVTDRVLQLAPWASAADRVAQRANVTTYLMRRSGMEAVCVHKAEGRNVIRVIPVEVGQRRYLGVGAGATALLAGLPDSGVDQIITAIAPELAAFADLSPERIREAVAEARRTGFAESQGRAYRSIYGLGMGVAAHAAEPDIAISIAAHAPEVDDARIAEWKAIIREEIAATQKALPARA
ncbi:IclR family transcriptional regulator [Mesobacterium pallidum]|uniref:IclR family transcriptional regulator n=1 Tax=Mesobacterium pallidum TaxID=2872037 RepID=UPI001EE34B10|nr:IclR family transcriptional regulator [Mesobacterium pallidum]